MPFRRIAAGAALSLAAGAATAEGFTIHDLGEMPSRDACLQRANKVLKTYIRQQGGWEVSATEWVVYAWDLAPSDNDVALMCPILPSNLVNAVLVVYGEHDDAASDPNREFVAETINSMWFQ